MKFLKKLKSSNFWVSMTSAVVLILQAVFNVDIKTEYLSQIIMAMLGVLVMTGIVSDGSSSETQGKQEVNIENLTQSLSKIFTQTIAGMETNMLSIVTQFEKITESFTSQKIEQIADDSQVEIEDIKLGDKAEILNDEIVSQGFELNVDKYDKTNVNDESNQNNLTELQNVDGVKTSSLNVL